VLTDAYAGLVFDVLDDEALWSMVLAGIVESTSQPATMEILEEFGVEAPRRNMLMAPLGRCPDRDCRGTGHRLHGLHSQETHGG
jgi:hypothetical protein